jgi:hypothetical protein
VITLAGVTIRRVCVPELADRLVHAGYNKTASKLLTASSEQQQKVDLTAREGAEILTVLLKDAPEGLRELRDFLATRAKNLNKP